MPSSTYATQKHMTGQLCPCCEHMLFPCELNDDGTFGTNGSLDKNTAKKKDSGCVAIEGEYPFDCRNSDKIFRTSDRTQDANLLARYARPLCFQGKNVTKPIVESVIIANAKNISERNL